MEILQEGGTGPEVINMVLAMAMIGGRRDITLKER